MPKFEVVMVDEDRNKRAMDSLKQVLKAFLEFTCSLQEVEDEQTRFSVLSDLLSLIYKAPMLISHAPVKESSTPTTAHEYFFTYVIARHYRDFNTGDPLNFMAELEKERKRLDALFQYVAQLREVYEALLDTPADTRPGYNFTSLAAHLELTSLMVWLLQEGSLDLNYLRLAALLHDVGKLTAPEAHVREGSQLLQGLGESCLDMKRVLDLVEKHHDRLFSLVTRSDHLASASERLKDVVEREVQKYRLRECFQMTARQAADCYSKYRNEYIEASKKIYVSVLKSVMDEGQLDDVKRDQNKLPYLSEVESATRYELREPTGTQKTLGYLVYVDFPGIQRFLTDFPKLRDISFASLFVDFMVGVYAFARIDELFRQRSKSKLPAEALLSAYGGHSMIVVRADLPKEEIAGLKIGSDKLEVNLDVRVADFASDAGIRNYNEIWEELESQAVGRFVVNWEEKVYSPGLHAVCSSCGVRPALAVDRSEDKLCERCSSVRSESKIRGFSARVDTTYLVGGTPVKPRDSAGSMDVNERAMEFIAGDREDEGRYAAVVKADGNNAGVIFRYNATFSEYLDKSFRLDYWMKRAFYDTLVKVGDKDLQARILAGVQYVGGDDLFLIMPSLISIPFLVEMFKRVEEGTGFKFKVGVVAVKKDHPVQFAYRTSNELMKSSKYRLRTKNRDEDGTVSTISCLVYSSTLATEGSVNRLKELWRGNLTFVRFDNPLDNVEGLLKLVKIDLANAVKLWRGQSPDPDVDPEDWARDKLRPLEEITGYSLRNDPWTALSYMVRQRSREDDQYVREVTDFVLKSRKVEEHGGDFTWKFPALDYREMIKTVRVGLGTKGLRP